MKNWIASIVIVVSKTSYYTEAGLINGQIIKFGIIKIYEMYVVKCEGLTYTSLLFDTGWAAIVVQQRLEQRIERSDLR